MDVKSTRKSRRPGPSVWLAVLAFGSFAGCTTYLGTTPKSFLRHARSNPDPNIRYLAYAKLGSPDLYDDPRDKDEAIETLVAKLDEGREPVAVRVVIIRALGNLGDRRGRNAIARVVNDPNTEPILKVEACRSLGKVGRPDDARTLVRIMSTDSLEDCRIAAIEGIGALKVQDPDIHHILIEGMDHEDPAIRLQCYRALKQVTGKDLGTKADAWRRELEPKVAASDKAAAPAAAKSAKDSPKR